MLPADPIVRALVVMLAALILAAAGAIVSLVFAGGRLVGAW